MYSDSWQITFYHTAGVLPSFNWEYMCMYASWIIHQKRNQYTFMRSWKYLFFLQMERTLDVRHCTSFWWFTSTPSSISLLTSSSSPALAAIMRSLQSSIWNAAVRELQLHKTWHCHNDLFSAFHICNHQMLWLIKPISLNPLSPRSVL